jgi:ABC-type transport system involved in cytochrome bd biosynthesis fused ATPase/permease subunit
MIHIRNAAISVILAATITSGLALAQTSTPPSAKAAETKFSAKPSKTTETSSTSVSSAVTSVENWSRKQWNATTKEWSKDKARWSDCRKQSTDQKLSGRKSWSFLYQCMKKA